MAEVAKLKVTEIPLHDKVLLLGPPGIGKTEAVRQLAESEARLMGRKFIDIEEYLERGGDLLELYERVKNNPKEYYIFYRIVATHITPESLDVPVPIAESGFKNFVYSTPLVFAILSLPGVAGTLFIDELTNIQRDDTKSVMYALIQEKRLGTNLKLSPYVKIVAAGNPKSVSSIANELPAPLINRLTVIDTAPATLDEWEEYMLSTNLSRLWRIVSDIYSYALEKLYEKMPEREKARICGVKTDEKECRMNIYQEIFRKAYTKALSKAITYLRSKAATEGAIPPQFLADDIPGETLENFPTPRSWTRLVNQLTIEELLREAGLVDEKLYEKRVAALSIGALGPSVGSEFQKLYLYAYISPVDIIDAIENGTIKKLLNKIINGIMRGDEKARVAWFSFTFSLVRLPFFYLGSVVTTAKKILEEMDAKKLLDKENLAGLLGITVTRLETNVNKLEKTLMRISALKEEIPEPYGEQLTQAIAEATNSLSAVIKRIRDAISTFEEYARKLGVNCSDLTEEIRESEIREDVVICKSLTRLSEIVSKLLQMHDSIGAVIRSLSRVNIAERLEASKGKAEGNMS